MRLRHFLSLTIVSLWLTTLWANAETITKGQPVAPFTPQLKAGEYVWHPEVSPTGPVMIVVSLSEQILYVYRNGIRIGRSSISSGKPGRSTPVGVFTILQKNVKHTSTLFKGASMPYMERLTWRGVALHGGNLPGYPASHGCVRLPLDFAQQLYTVTSNGTTVIVTNQKTGPGQSKSPGLLFSATANAVTPPGRIFWQPEKSPTGPVSILMSSADGAVYVYRNAIEIGRAPVAGLGGFTGSYVYSALEKFDPQGRYDWLTITSVGGLAPDLKSLVKKTTQNPQFLANVRALITTGTTLILTDTAVNVSQRSGASLDILTTAEAN